jgi:hypothetical protein
MKQTLTGIEHDNIIDAVNNGDAYSAIPIVEQILNACVKPVNEDRIKDIITKTVGTYLSDAVGKEIAHALAVEFVRALKLPEIICLCGSTRFFKDFDKANFKFTLQGKIVLSIGCNTKCDTGLGITEKQKKELDELHKRKIDLCNKVYVLNIGGYIGSSTRSEIDYAMEHGKPIEYAEPIISAQRGRV